MQISLLLSVIYPFSLDRAFTSSFMAFVSPSARRSFHGVRMAGVVCAYRRISYFPSHTRSRSFVYSIVYGLLFSVSRADHFHGVCIAEEMSVHPRMYLLLSITCPISRLIVYSRHHLWPSLLRLCVDRFMVYPWQELSVHADVSLTFHDIHTRSLDRLFTSPFMAFASPSHASMISWCT